MTEPLSDDDVERLLHDLMRQVLEVGAATPAGRAALRIGLAGLYGALVNLDRAMNQPEPLPPPPP